MHPHNSRARGPQLSRARESALCARMHSHFARYLSLRLTDARSRFSWPRAEIMSPIVARRLVRARGRRGVGRRHNSRRAFAACNPSCRYFSLENTWEPGRRDNAFAARGTRVLRVDPPRDRDKTASATLGRRGSKCDTLVASCVYVGVNACTFLVPSLQLSCVWMFRFWSTSFTCSRIFLRSVRQTGFRERLEVLLFEIARTGYIICCFFLITTRLVEHSAFIILRRSLLGLTFRPQID